MQAISPSEGITILAKNIADGLDSSEHANALFAEIAEHDPDVIVWSEASSTSTDPRVIAFAGFLLESAGYKVTFGRSSEDRDDGHYILGAAKAERLPQLEMVPLAAGRQAVHIAMQDADTGERIDMLGVHLNDHATPRDVETWSIAGRRNDIEAQGGNLVAVVGDCNTSLIDEPFTHLLQIGGSVAEFLKDRGLLTVAQPGDVDPPQLQRYASLLIRSGRQASGWDMQTLRRLGFEDADRTRQPTTFVPALPKLMKILDSKYFPNFISQPIKSWLAKPHLQNDHIAVRGGYVTDFKVIPGGPEDNHWGIFGRLRRTPASTAVAP